MTEPNRESGSFEFLSFSFSESIYPSLDEFTEFVLPVDYETTKNKEIQKEEIDLQVEEPTKTQQEKYDQQDIPSIIYHPFNQVNDTLLRLSLMYGVEIGDIKMANGILSCDDDLSFFEEDVIVIPGPTRIPNKIPEGRVEEEIEAQRRYMSLRFFQGIKHVNEDVAKCYLAVNDHNLQKAVKEYDEDVAWENQQKLLKKESSKKNGFFDFLLCCYTKSQYIMVQD
eukprot:gene1498-12115_t